MKKKKKPSQKMGRRPKQTFLQRKHTDAQQAHEKVDAQDCSLLEKWKSKLQRGITSDWSE